MTRNSEYKEPTPKEKLVVDNQNIRLIDANALIKRLRPKHFDWWGEGEQDDFGKGNNSMLEEVIEAIEVFPSVTPQEPILDKYQAEIDYLHKYIARLERQITDSFINKSCVSEKVCEHDKNVVIDKIRAEIESLERFEIRGENTPLINGDNVLHILDKYKADKEQK